jgi:hypothetical protein
MPGSFRMLRGGAGGYLPGLASQQLALTVETPNGTDARQSSMEAGGPEGAGAVLDGLAGTTRALPPLLPTARHGRGVARP